MALHDLVYDCSIQRANDKLPMDKRIDPVQKIELSLDEETALRAQWAAEDVKRANLPPAIGSKERMDALEATVAALQAKVGK